MNIKCWPPPPQVRRGRARGGRSGSAIPPITNPRPPDNQPSQAGTLLFSQEPITTHQPLFPALSKYNLMSGDSSKKDFLAPSSLINARSFQMRCNTLHFFCEVFMDRQIFRDRDWYFWLGGFEPMIILGC